MDVRSPLLRVVFIAMAMAMFSACAHKEDAARKAVAQVDSAVAAVAQEGKRLFPPAFAALAAQNEQLKAKLADGDYAAVVADAPAVLAKAKDLAAQVAVKNKDTIEKLTAEWTRLETSVPAAIAAAESRMQDILKSGKSPTGADPSVVTMAQAGVGEYQTLWARAVAAHGAGNLAEAVEVGSTTLRRVQALTRVLGGGTT
jgi:hypothetical protein